MTTEHDRTELLTLRSAILELARAYEELARDRIREEMDNCTAEGYNGHAAGFYEGGKLTKSITETLAASAAKGETGPDNVASRIFDILRETEERLGIKLTKEGNNG